MRSKYVIFDLDDTLVYEFEYLKSAYREIAEYLDSENSEQLYDDMLAMYMDGKNVFEDLTAKYPPTELGDLLNIYRNHLPPSLNLTAGAIELLDFCRSQGFGIGLITDGRSLMQRNKLKALGIEGRFDKIVVSEEFGTTKPDERNYKFFMDKACADYFYIADNPEKDFIAPNRLGWTTVCLLDRGNNIHSQKFDQPNGFLPKIKVSSLLEVIPIINR